MDQNKKNLKILQLLLFCGGFGFFISIFGVFMPWPAVAEQLEGLGAKELPADPMLNYWLRMQAGANTLVGLFLFALALNPLKYKNVISFAWILLVGEGCILLVWGLLLRLSPLPFVVDSLFCLVIGIGILLSSRLYLSENEIQ
ncbi:MAG: hypothetical protein ACYSOF_03430 [Planctomycetota bacterium]